MASGRTKFRGFDSMGLPWAAIVGPIAPHGRIFVSGRAALRTS